jgi:prepilin-type N-terminal cleavage/methylation domain-containing protein
MEMRRPVQFRRNRSFTLIELLVVMGVIAVLLVAIVPAVNSLSKSSGRKAAMNNLLGAIEQARTLAIKDGQATYVAFPDQIAGANTATVDRYSYKSYAIFEDDEANPGSVKQITPWRTLPAGVSLRSGNLNNFAKTTAFAFTPAGAGAAFSFPFLKFNSSGEVDPSSTPGLTTGPVQIGIFEGFVDSSGGDRDTNKSKPTENVSLDRLTGRAERK